VCPPALQARTDPATAARRSRTVFPAPRAATTPSSAATRSQRAFHVPLARYLGSRHVFLRAMRGWVVLSHNGLELTDSCPAGSACAANSTSATPCPTTFCPYTNMTDPLACPAGRYCADSGLTAGHSVRGSTARQRRCCQCRCPVLTYQDEEGASGCESCAKQAVPGTGQVACGERKLRCRKTSEAVLCNCRHIFDCLPPPASACWPHCSAPASPLSHHAHLPLWSLHIRRIFCRLRRSQGRCCGWSDETAISAGADARRDIAQLQRL